MSTIDKALEVLELFSGSRPALGLSEAARLLERDKASVLRHISALVRHGYLEQDPATRAYRLGPAVARLAMVREETYPLHDAVRDILNRLVAETGESAHFAQYGARAMLNVAHQETPRAGTRVHLDPAEAFPLHASASGLAFLAALNPERRAELLAEPFALHTPRTPSNREQVLRLVEEAARRGYAIGWRSYDDDVVGIAAPVHDASGQPCGSVAVATPVVRMNETREAEIAASVMAAARDLSAHLGAPGALTRAAE